MKHRTRFLCLLTALTACLVVPASALLFTGDDQLSVAAFAKNGTAEQAFTFSTQDFLVQGNGNATLDSIVLTSLPDPGAGLLKLGDQELETGDSIALSALEGMRFYPLSTPVVSQTTFTFTPVFSDGLAGEDTTVSLYLLEEENSAPVAQDLKLETYKNVAIEGQLTAVDPEGDLVTFQLMSKPARGQVTLSEDTPGTFVYTPYENKTGKDSFTYVAVDSVGNTSAKATVKIRISKPDTKVTYADMEGVSAHKAAIRLAEEDIFVGSCMDGVYYFQPELPVSRAQFVAMAMSAAGLEALEDVTITGFSDDPSIPAWAKGYLSSGLMSGMVRGVPASDGSIAFQAGNTVTKAEAAVFLDRLLSITDVAAQGEADPAIPTWAYQSVMNMDTVAVIGDTAGMSAPLTRGETAEMLCGMLEVLDHRK